MRGIIVFFIGIFLIFMSFSYFYKPGWIIKINSFFKENIFNDYFVLKSRRLRAVLYLIAGLIFLYWAIQ